MPIKNAALYLEECLDSILKQDFEDWELIAINDHSSDRTKDILINYKQIDQRVLVLDNKGAGIIPALQMGYQFSSGTYITRMDADDIMSVDKLSSLYHLLSKSPRGRLATGKVKYFSEYPLGDGYKKYEKWLNHLCIKNSHFSEIYKECVIASPCWMVHREDFDKLGAFNNDIYPEDYDLCFRFYEYNLKVVSVNSILHYWRDYAIRSSRTDENYQDNRFLSLKTNYFLKIDFNDLKPLFLWGAGKKAKKIAQILLDKKVLFHWISNNAKKIGKDIYGVRIHDQSSLTDHTQVIVAVANKMEQLEIKNIISYKVSIDTYWFS